MEIALTAQGIVTAGAVVGALSVLVALVVKAVHWVDRQRAQDKELLEVQEELSLLTYGVLACLKGLEEQGCNGPVREAVGKIEKHINKKAHELGGGGNS